MMPSTFERLARKARDEQGSVLIMTAFSMFALLGFLGLALDVGALYHHRRLLQTAADAGAISGGAEVLRGQAALVIPSARLPGFCHSWKCKAYRHHTDHTCRHGFNTYHRADNIFLS